jgi:hypothetical protein
MFPCKFLIPILLASLSRQKNMNTSNLGTEVGVKQ